MKDTTLVVCVAALAACWASTASLGQSSGDSPGEAESASGTRLSGCGAQPPSTTQANVAAPGLISLAEDIDTFSERFNTTSDKPRFVAILSSTCGPCVSGAVTTNEAIVKSFSNAGIDVSVVWIDILPSDGADSAARASTIFDDPGVTQYHDPNQLLGNAFAEGLLKRPPAWDIYLFYAAGATWDGGPPKPSDWMHQLGGAVAEKSRYKTKVLLAAEMHEAMTRLGFKADNPAPTSEQLARARTAATARIGEAAACGVPAKGGEQCSRCAASGTIGQCSVSGWRYIVASLVHDENGEPTGRFELRGAATGPMAAEQVDVNDTRYDFTVDGMVCPDCATQVAGKVLQVPGVARVEVDYDRKLLIVYARGEHGSKLEMLPPHLELGGYRVTPLAAPEKE